MTEFFSSLRRIRYFKDLDDDDLGKVAALCRQKGFKQGETIFSEGDPPDNFYIILDGSVEVWKNYSTEEQEFLAHHGPGNFFGEMALIDEKPRSATVIASIPTETLYLSENDFAAIIRTNSSVALSIMMFVTQVVRTSNDSFVENLRARNKALEKANRELRETQSELLRAERLSTLGKFSSLILHDIRNPLSVLQGYAEMIAINPDDSERTLRCSRKILLEADRLNRLTSELLDYSRGEIRLNLSVVDLKVFFDNLREHIQQKFEARGITIKFIIEIEMPVLMDNERMFRALYNLADNAWKAMRSGGTLTIHVFQEGGTMTVSVQDTGEGMEPQILQHVFEPFYSSSVRGGTGLGMLVVKNVVEAHEGTISIESQIGKGTTVSVRLPLKY